MTSLKAVRGDSIQCYSHTRKWGTEQSTYKKFRALQNFWNGTDELHIHLTEGCALAGNI